MVRLRDEGGTSPRTPAHSSQLTIMLAEGVRHRKKNVTTGKVKGEEYNTKARSNG